MDSAVSGGIDTVLTNLWNYFFSGSIPTTYQDGTAARIQPVYTLGYGGAALAFFLSVAGAYIAGSTTIKQVENSFFAFLEDFQDERYDQYVGLMDDEEESPAFSSFLTAYAWDLMVLAFAVYWHIMFLIGMGAAEAYLLFSKTNELDKAATDNSSYVSVTHAWPLVLYGFLLGATNFMAGQAVSANSLTDNETLLKMTGLTSVLDTEVETTQSTVTDPVKGDTQTTITTIYDAETKKDFFALKEIMEYWGTLFTFQRMLQVVLPYIYICFLEGAVLMSFSLTLIFM